ncbi:uncharacterized protein LOC132628059 [Lycium barbarum]|uniref:uncharacterized protein LOC132628059 n=1 Tax=Lycium barbarum TaxID=112863 RepID=UPI00293F5A8D|nr:uncharacterized protein LOC132628059 [Lycium barbarum]
MKRAYRFLLQTLSEVGPCRFFLIRISGNTDHIKFPSHIFPKQVIFTTDNGAVIVFKMMLMLERGQEVPQDEVFKITHTRKAKNADGTDQWIERRRRSQDNVVHALVDKDSEEESDHVFNTQR